MDDDVIRIPLRARDGSVRAWAIVDREDADLAELRWHLGDQGYARRTIARADRPGGCSAEKLHRIVLARAIDRPLNCREQCDHKNRDPLDNRRANLRIATQSQNQANRSAHNDSLSSYIGVSLDLRTGKWLAKTCKDKRQIHIGRFADESEAARAYDRAARECHGEYARLNFPDGDA